MHEWFREAGWAGQSRARFRGMAPKTRPAHVPFSPLLPPCPSFSVGHEVTPAMFAAANAWLDYFLQPDMPPGAAPPPPVRLGGLLAEKVEERS